MKPKRIQKVKYYKITTESKLIKNIFPAFMYLPASNIFRVLWFLSPSK